MHGQQRYTSTAARQRNISREERSPSLIFTVLTVGGVVLLLAVTFMADWLRTPELVIIGAPQFLSPNSDKSYDNATINYSLSEEAQVSALVLSEGGGLVRTLLAGQAQMAGQHFLVWNGTDNAGRAVVDGTYRVEISARGAVRSSATSVVLLVDTLPPVLQLLNLQDGTRVRESMLVVEGLTDFGATIWLNGGFQPIPVDGAGRFRTQYKLAEGDNRIEVKAIDTAGNTNILFRTVQLVTEAPQVLITSPAEGAWINNPLVTVEGQAPANVSIKINNQPVAVSPDGRFRLDVLMEEGDQRFTVTAVDDVGNVTTIERVVRVKTRGPSIEVNVAEGAAFSDPQLQLSGTTSPGAAVLVNQRQVAVGALGDFQTTVQLLEGDNLITIQARDQAGNVSMLTRQVRYSTAVPSPGWERLAGNFNRLPGMTIPAVLLISLALGLFLYRQNQLDIELSVDTQRFVPGLPQEAKNLTLRLDLNHPARVTLEVLDAAGQPMAVLLDNRRRSAREHLFLWDGYDDFGQPVPPGIYTIRATAGAPPMRASSAVQVLVEADPYVYRKAGQFEQIQPGLQATIARRRMRQNRKRI